MTTGTRKTVTAVNLSTQQEMTFMGVSPAHAVAYAYHDEIGSLSTFLNKTHDGHDWERDVTKGNYTVIMGNWCALCTVVTEKNRV
jgi:hypothetical protein